MARRRRNPDERMRRLERQAALGDADAQAKLEAMRRRATSWSPPVDFRLQEGDPAEVGSVQLHGPSVPTRPRKIHEIPTPGLVIVRSLTGDRPGWGRQRAGVKGGVYSVTHWQGAKIVGRVTLAQAREISRLLAPLTDWTQDQTAVATADTRERVEDAIRSVIGFPNPGPDERRRQLERQASLGDQEAAERLRAEQLRAPSTPEEADAAQKHANDAYWEESRRQTWEAWQAGTGTREDYMRARSRLSRPDSPVEWRTDMYWAGRGRESSPHLVPSGLALPMDQADAVIQAYERATKKPWSAALGQDNWAKGRRPTVAQATQIVRAFYESLGWTERANMPGTIGDPRRIASRPLVSPDGNQRVVFSRTTLRRERLHERLGRSGWARDGDADPWGDTVGVIDLAGALMRRAVRSKDWRTNPGPLTKAGLTKGGLASKAKRKLASFDRRQLDRGMRVELEHTSSKKLARAIAADHLTEDPRYYDKLVNPDERMRRLERQAALGDVEAQRELEAMRQRVEGPPPPECYYCGRETAEHGELCELCADENASEECAACGLEGMELSGEGLCDWCAADAEGRPYGSCPSCGGARARDRSCACRPRRRNPDEPMRRRQREGGESDDEVRRRARDLFRVGQVREAALASLVLDYVDGRGVSHYRSVDPEIVAAYLAVRGPRPWRGLEHTLIDWRLACPVFVSDYGYYGVVPHSELAVHARVAGKPVLRWAVRGRASWPHGDPGDRASYAKVEVLAPQGTPGVGNRLWDAGWDPGFTIELSGLVGEVLPDEIRRQLGGFGNERVPPPGSPGGQGLDCRAQA